MPLDASSTLVLSDGGLPSFVVSAIAAERATRERNANDAAPVVWCCPVLPRARGGPSLDEAAAAVERQADTLGLDVEVATPSLWTTRKHVDDALLSVFGRATQIAADRGLDRILWPVTAAPSPNATGPDLDLVAAVVDAATSIARASEALARVERGVSREIEVETPVVDLTGRQILDLVDDFALDTASCWWGMAPSEAAAREAARWEELGLVAGSSGNA